VHSTRRRRRETGHPRVDQSAALLSREVPRLPVPLPTAATAALRRVSSELASSWRCACPTLAAAASHLGDDLGLAGHIRANRLGDPGVTARLSLYDRATEAIDARVGRRLDGVARLGLRGAVACTRGGERRRSRSGRRGRRRGSSWTGLRNGREVSQLGVGRGFRSRAQAAQSPGVSTRERPQDAPHLDRSHPAHLGEMAHSRPVLRGTVLFSCL